MQISAFLRKDKWAKNYYVNLSRLIGKRTKRSIGDAKIITSNQTQEYAEKIIAEIKLTEANPYEKKKPDEFEIFMKNGLL